LQVSNSFKIDQNILIIFYACISNIAKNSIYLNTFRGFKAAARGARACYELQESTDGINFVTVKVSPDSHYKYAHGKAEGTKIWFRGRLSLSEKMGGAQTWLHQVDEHIFTK